MPKKLSLTRKWYCCTCNLQDPMFLYVVLGLNSTTAIPIFFHKFKWKSKISGANVGFNPLCDTCMLILPPGPAALIMVV